MTVSIYYIIIVVVVHFKLFTQSHCVCARAHKGVLSHPHVISKHSINKYKIIIERQIAIVCCVWTGKNIQNQFQCHWEKVQCQLAPSAHIHTLPEKDDIQIFARSTFFSSASRLIWALLKINYVYIFFVALAFMFTFPERMWEFCHSFFPLLLCFVRLIYFHFTSFYEFQVNIECADFVFITLCLVCKR